MRDVTVTTKAGSSAVGRDSEEGNLLGYSFGAAFHKPAIVIADGL
jgi:hypothetical protein